MIRPHPAAPPIVVDKPKGIVRFPPDEFEVVNRISLPYRVRSFEVVNNRSPPVIATSRVEYEYSSMWREVELYDIDNMKTLKSYQLEYDECSMIIFMRSLNVLIGIMSKKLLQIDLNNDKIEYDICNTKIAMIRRVFSLMFLMRQFNSSCICFTSEDGAEHLLKVTIFDVEKRKVVKEIRRRRDEEIKNVFFEEDSNIIHLCGQVNRSHDQDNKGFVRSMNIETNEEFIWKEYECEVTAIAKDKDRIITGDENGGVQLWKISEGQDSIEIVRKWNVFVEFRGSIVWRIKCCSNICAMTSFESQILKFVDLNDPDVVYTYDHGTSLIQLDWYPRTWKYERLIACCYGGKIVVWENKVCRGRAERERMNKEEKVYEHERILFLKDEFLGNFFFCFYL